jgi:hypothetical protein
VSAYLRVGVLPLNERLARFVSGFMRFGRSGREALAQAQLRPTKPGQRDVALLVSGKEMGN